MSLEDLERELFGVQCTMRQYEPRVAALVKDRLNGVVLRGEQAQQAAFVLAQHSALKDREAALMLAIEAEHEVERQRQQIPGYASF